MALSDSEVIQMISILLVSLLLTILAASLRNRPLKVRVEARAPR